MGTWAASRRDSALSRFTLLYAGRRSPLPESRQDSCQASSQRCALVTATRRSRSSSSKRPPSPIRNDELADARMKRWLTRNHDFSPRRIRYVSDDLVSDRSQKETGPGLRGKQD